ncbi:MAG: putative toxin-antitoxin system toxin component, PIN family [Treponema sp.]|nr:putative toxin-antitoxin system toxin component, PIN family [Treponema sp.]
MRVVLDTNIFFSSFYWAGNPRKVFDRITKGLDELFITDEILNEIVSVMEKKKYKVNKNEINEYIKIIESYSIKIISKNIPEVSRDIDDNKILQCAVDGNCDFIITGDEDLLVLREYNNIKIIKPREYLELFFN